MNVDEFVDSILPNKEEVVKNLDCCVDARCDDCKYSKLYGVMCYRMLVSDARAIVVSGGRDNFIRIVNSAVKRGDIKL